MFKPTFPKPRVVVNFVVTTSVWTAVATIMRNATPDDDNSYRKVQSFIARHTVAAMVSDLAGSWTDRQFDQLNKEHPLDLIIPKDKE